MKKRNPIRMCIACRNRESQRLLLRLQFENGRVVPYKGYGRSSYICRECSRNRRKIIGLIKRFKVSEESFVQLLKEWNING